jgi:hypothetical protein
VADRGVPRAEDGLAPDRHLTRLALIAAALPLVLAACGSAPYTQVGFRNDLQRPVQLGLCTDVPCRQVRWWIGIDPDAIATEQVRSDGKATRRFLVVGPPDTVYGCLVFHFPRVQPDVTVRVSSARGCGSGR